MTDRRKQKRVFHINLLRAWHAPTAVCYWSEAATDSSDGGDDPIMYFEPSCDGEPTFGDSLSPAQLTDLCTIWQKFDFVLSSTPGCTTIVEHRITTGQAKPVRLPPYRIPYAYRQSARNLGKWRRKG